MKIWEVIGIVLFVYGSEAMAASLSCEIRISDSPVLRQVVTPQKQSKVVIGEIGIVSAYVLEKENQHYLIEALLPQSDARIYAEGALRSSQDRLVASLWGRNLLTDIECRLKALGK